MQAFLSTLAAFLADSRVHAALLGLIAAAINWWHPATTPDQANQLAAWLLLVATAWLLPSGTRIAQPSPPAVPPAGPTKPPIAAG